MTTDATPPLNLIGFITGTVLYSMLLWMVLGAGRSAPLPQLPLLTGILGLVWNLGASASFVLSGLGLFQNAPVIMALAYSALCFLPAVVVHSVESETFRLKRGLIPAAYTMSLAASLMHFAAALSWGRASSDLALRGLTLGFGGLMIVLFFTTRGQANWQRALWVGGLSFFAVSALHLSDHSGLEPWWVELIGHHASVPLAVTILYQDYRFALADIFLKRALALMLLVAAVFGLYVNIEGGSVVLLLSCWVGTALLYPVIRTWTDRFVDAVVLRRPDYGDVLAGLAAESDRVDRVEDLLDRAGALLSRTLTARAVTWTEAHGARGKNEWLVAPAEAPRYRLTIGPLAGGRKLLSGELAFLDRAVLILAHKIDTIRTARERLDNRVREEEMRKLAVEAELKALRAQINPHFLFNALTTIGHLIQTAPDRALATLLRLSRLLRGVLQSGDHFVSLGEELDLIESYLEIEKVRFEHRLEVRIDIPPELREARIPALLLQPLAENAIKHGISPSATGGALHIEGRREDDQIVLVVRNTGVGATAAEITRGRKHGVGLNNVERRLDGLLDSARLEVRSGAGPGVEVEVRMPFVWAGKGYSHGGKVTNRHR